jgi:hypothetical protein
MEEERRDEGGGGLRNRQRRVRMEEKTLFCKDADHVKKISFSRI